ncbi:uncharacterized protein STEHIDRAFT_155354 [Stereum hirsutum FP-91666 SS1]|uniref:uncharacterized protein n=1 Tax=Stereum hirsutum (strain FP-91666) TaxID=721885 RepID=UPI000440D4B2|nr:uncharacterized protein STEHIDRAFT_155354 [Stereum hirsutum FP-91666 SS1]EIM87995.1 hypothetical protein STEHIDRAFT_155354 [Stereum hirsutum FP-91666 SS1]
MVFAPEDIFAIQLRMVSNSAVVSAAALWLGDYIATLPEEIYVIWLHRPTFRSAVFLLNRYSILLHMVLCGFFTFSANGTDQTCQGIGYPMQFILFNCEALMALRVYALYNRNRVVGLTSIAFIVLRTALALYIDFILQVPAGTIGTNLESLSRCQLVSPDPTSLAICEFSAYWTRQLYSQPSMILPVSFLDRQFINSALSFFYDLFVIVLTLRKSYSHVLDMRRFGLGQHSVAQVLLRDGIFYFASVSGSWMFGTLFENGLYLRIMLVMSCVMALMGMLSFFIGGKLDPERSPFFDIIAPFWIMWVVLPLNKLVSADHHLCYRASGAAYRTS